MISCNSFKKVNPETYEVFNKSTYKLKSINGIKTFYYNDERKDTLNLYFDFGRVKRNNFFKSKDLKTSKITVTDFNKNRNLDKIICVALLQKYDKKIVDLFKGDLNRGHNLYQSYIYKFLIDLDGK